MSALSAAASAMTQHLEGARFPLYLVGEGQRILFANQALQEWADLSADQILGRRVEYHAASPDETASPLTGLCPAPEAMAGRDSEGTVSATGRDGRLRHRRARFLTLPAYGATATDGRDNACSVLVWVADVDLTADELLAQVSSPKTHDQRQLAVRQFSKDFGAAHEMAALLGTGLATRQMRRQAEAAAKSGANAIVLGPSATDAELVARAIHRLTSRGNEAARLEPLHVESLSPEQIEHRIHRAAHAEGGAVTLLLLGLEQSAEESQAWLANCLEAADREPRCLAAMAEDIDQAKTEQKLERTLQAKLGILTIGVPPLVDRTTDLPLLAQLFLQRLNAAEAATNKAASAGNKQLGGIAPDALDRLALYSWPGGVAQLQEVMAEAYRQATGPLVELNDLPKLIHHASVAAEFPGAESVKIDLDQYLQAIEKELIQRAMATVGDNKAEAARLLGVTRQRLYRSLERIEKKPEKKSGKKSEKEPEKNSLESSITTPSSRGKQKSRGAIDEHAPEEEAPDENALDENQDTLRSSAEPFEELLGEQPDDEETE